MATRKYLAHFRYLFVSTLILTGWLCVNALAQQPNATLASMSEKQLFKKAEADQAAGRLEEAREALIVALGKKKKPNKKYDPVLAAVNKTLADREADKAEGLCRRMDLVNCQLSVESAKKYASTDRVKSAETNLQALIGQVVQRFEEARKLAASNPVKALTELKGLAQFQAHLPNVKAETDRVTGLAVRSLLTEGTKSVEGQRWEEASLRFQQVLDLAKDNSDATKGLNAVERGRKGYSQHQEATMQLNARKYPQALFLVESALKTYPEGKEFETTKEQIMRRWIQHLQSDLPTLMSSPEDLKSSRMAYLNLDQLRTLDPSCADLKKYWKPASENFGTNLLQKAAELETVVDYSRIATAFLMKLGAKQLLPTGTIKTEELKGVATIFNRKRASQLLLSVDDLVGTSPVFKETVAVRTRNILENLGLSDLKIRSLEEYHKSPNEDPQFQDLRPDGKSSTAFLTVAIAKYESERKKAEKPIQKASRYISGTDMVLNPDFVKAQEELNAIRKALENPKRKQGKPTPEGWTERTYSQKEQELGRIERSVAKEKITDYKYQEFVHKQHTTVELTITLRDYLSKELIGSDTIRFHDERDAIELEGVQDRDVNGLRNQAPLIQPPDQVLRDAERTTLEAMNSKIGKLLPMYANRYFKEGERAMKDGRLEDAAESFICHWTFLRSRPEPSQSELVLDVIKSETGFDLKREGPTVMAMISAGASGSQ